MNNPPEVEMRNNMIDGHPDYPTEEPVRKIPKLEPPVKVEDKNHHENTKLLPNPESSENFGYEEILGRVTSFLHK